jgi:hypothetical protein
MRLVLVTLALTSTMSACAQRDNLRPFAPAREAVREPTPSTTAAARCSFLDSVLPIDLIVVAAGSYSGRKLDFQIDSSGHQATQFDIAVHTDKPVALLLGAYEPTVWNIGWTENTRIVAVFATGYHRQVVAGLPGGMPVITSSYETKSPCGYNYIGSEASQLTWLNPKARSVFGKKVTRVYTTHANGFIEIVEADRLKEAYVTSADAPPESFKDAAAPLAGEAGLDEGVRNSLIRPLTNADLQAVRAAFAEHARQTTSPSANVPPIAGVSSAPEPAVRVPEIALDRGYMVLKEFVFPAGLYGGNLAYFVVPRGVPTPTGNPGHSTVVDLNTITCSGVLCRVE